MLAIKLLWSGSSPSDDTGQILKLGLKTVSIIRYQLDPGVCRAPSYQTIGLADGYRHQGAESLPRK